MDRDPYEHAPASNDAERVLWAVRRMSAEGFARVFREGLSAQGLMTVITALPGDRLNGLMDRARRQAPRQPAPHLAKPSLADAIRSARVEAGMSQVEVAAALGVRQSSVSQWERGVTKPLTANLLALMRLLPGLAGQLGDAADDASKPRVSPQALRSSGRETAFEVEH
jgi:DNA-binding transcriptional regulator YiaG